MGDYHFEAACEDDTEKLGAALAECLPPGCVVSLIGPLGAGKTRLVRAVAAACGIDSTLVTSPTFVLMQHYQGRRLIHHLDAYRLDDEDALLDLDVEDYFNSDALSFVEWGNRVANVLPPDRVEIEISVLEGNARRFVVRTKGERFLSVVECLQRL